MRISFYSQHFRSKKLFDRIFTISIRIKMKSIAILVVTLCFHYILQSQPYSDYIGAGHNKGIVITSSSSQSKPYFHQLASGEQTINGSGLIGKKVEMARFLNQASFGYSEKELERATEIGIEEWINKQESIPQTKLIIMADSFAKVLYKFYIDQGEDPDDLSDNISWQHFRYAWWNTAVNGKDQLRQRMAYALSQILVISDDGEIGSFAESMCTYADILGKHAFGNYRDLLMEVTTSTAMGSYLSHLNNPREIPEENIHPDQNYAREIMQLFTIGLYELNNDGSRKKDNEGKDIPTYDNEDIAELAKVFTGLGISKNLEGMGDPFFGQNLYGADLKFPMTMYEEWHQQGEKKLFKSTVIPAGQSGMKDVEDAVNFLFNHQNTGPFVCRQLIQRMVSSNPSPAYINRVANVFNNDGAGVRGNMFAVAKAILMDEEARNCEYLDAPYTGKMIEPVLRMTNFFKSVGVDMSRSKYFFHHGYDLEVRAFQHPYSSPTVFNFYTPDYRPNGPLNDQNLSAPEFQILNTLSSLDFGNLSFGWTYYEYAQNNWENEYFYNPVNASDYFESAHDDEALMNQIDLLFFQGQMSSFTKDALIEAIKDIPSTLNGAREKINTAMYLALISPDYLIKK